MYYYGARYYEPKIMTWYGVDPLVEKYPFNGGYVYCGGNPVSRVDYNGMDWYSTTNEDGSESGKWFDSDAAHIDDNGVQYNYVGKTMNGFDAEGNFVYGAQDGQTYSSAPLHEFEVQGNAGAAMARRIHEAQNAFLTSPQLKIAALSMGALIAGPAVFEVSAPYIANAARYTYTVTSNAAWTAYNAGKYYSTSALINGIKGYGKAKTMAETGYNYINWNATASTLAGAVEGVFKSFDFMPPDTPYFIEENPFYKLSSDGLCAVINVLKKISK